jgi:hypothetical protein
MSDRDHQATEDVHRLADVGESMFPIFAVNVPMPADTLWPVDDAQPTGLATHSSHIANN